MKPTADSFLMRIKVTNRMQLPLYSSLLQCGFPSPAANHIEKVCDLNDLCIYNEEATFYARAVGESMTEAGIEPGDVLIVDAALSPIEGRIVVAWHNGDFTVKYIQFAPPVTILLPANPLFLPIYVQPDESFRVFGVVTHIIKKVVKL